MHVMTTWWSVVREWYLAATMLDCVLFLHARDTLRRFDLSNKKKFWLWYRGCASDVTHIKPRPQNNNIRTWQHFSHWAQYLSFCSKFCSETSSDKNNGVDKFYKSVRYVHCRFDCFGVHRHHMAFFVLNQYEAVNHPNLGSARCTDPISKKITWRSQQQMR